MFSSLFKQFIGNRISISNSKTKKPILMANQDNPTFHHRLASLPFYRVIKAINLKNDIEGISFKYSVLDVMINDLTECLMSDFKQRRTNK